jgi:hypothetical protein
MMTKKTKVLRVAEDITQQVMIPLRVIRIVEEIDTDLDLDQEVARVAVVVKREINDRDQAVRHERMESWTQVTLQTLIKNWRLNFVRIFKENVERRRRGMNMKVHFSGIQPES